MAVNQPVCRDRRERGLTVYRVALDRLDVLRVLVDADKLDATDLGIDG